LTIHPHTLALVYFVYLTVLSVVRGGARARRVSFVALAVTTAVSGALGWLPVTPMATLVEQTWRLALLLAGYHAAGAFYERPNLAFEARLLAIDRRLFAFGRALLPQGAKRARQRVVDGLLEAAYLSVYPIIPAGAAVVLLTGSPAAIDRFWTTVLAAGFMCYGTLPWVQTRPPRAIERTPPAATSLLRGLNLAILERGSVGVNTLPSGHAATAAAVALSVWSSAPDAGSVFAIVAILIAIATVAGRYHYAVDTVLGAVVGVGAWLLFA
jgi:membrane-associated phospholipid phosphatase